MPPPTDPTQPLPWRPPAARPYWAVLLLAVAAGGCSRSITFAPVEGVVTKDGRPVAKVEVIFFADGDTVGPRASGWTDDAGHYQLRADLGQEGAPVGRHRVCLLDRSTPPQPFGEEKKGTEDEKKPPSPKALRFPPEYSDLVQTPLRDVEVKPGPNTFDINLR